MSSKIRYGRISVGPVEISGLVEGLVSGLRDVGCDAEAVVSFPHPFQYGAAPSSWILNIWQKIGRSRSAVPRKSFFSKITFVVAHSAWAWLVLLWALPRFNIYIFLFGRTITNTEFELWLLRRLRRKIIFMGVGSDTRPPYIDGALFSDLAENDLPSASFLEKASRLSKARLKTQELYADYWINAPASAQFHERSYINWSVMGVPKKIIAPPVKSEKISSSVRILHSPSNAAAKGTQVIQDAVDRLREKGYQIEFIKIQGMPNSRVVEELGMCDFVVDQVYSDAPMAGLAIEAAFFGKPTVVGGYFSSWVNKCVGLEDLPPTYFVLPDDIESAIEKLIVDVQERRELGERARAFVLERWSLRKVAENFLRLFADDVPGHWWCDPRAFCYLEGFGLPREKVRQLVASLIREKGVSALQLSDKPEFEAEFCRFIGCPAGR